MTDDRYVRTRETYDLVAGRYTERFTDELDGKPYDRERLGRLATELSDASLIADFGCGPGQIGRYLADRGCTVLGVDLSPQMCVYGSRANPSMRFLSASFFALPFADDVLGGAVAFYSLIHCRRSDVTDALREIRRVLRAGAPLLVALHGGNEDVHADEFLGETVSFDATFFELDEFVGYMRDAGFTIADAEARPTYEQEGGTERIYITGRA